MCDLFGYKAPLNAKVRAEKEMRETERYICEDDLDILETLLRNQDDEIVDSIAEYVWRAVAELRRLRHKLGESDLSMLAADFYAGDQWHSRDIAIATPDEKFRRFLEAIATRGRNGGMDSDEIQRASGLSYWDFKDYAILLVDAQVLEFSFAV